MLPWFWIPSKCPQYTFALYVRSYGKWEFLGSSLVLKERYGEISKTCWQAGIPPCEGLKWVLYWCLHGQPVGLWVSWLEFLLRTDNSLYQRNKAILVGIFFTTKIQ